MVKGVIDHPRVQMGILLMLIQKDKGNNDFKLMEEFEFVDYDTL